jgi:uncharacterized protein (DUF1778 family)
LLTPVFIVVFDRPLTLLTAYHSPAAELLTEISVKGTLKMAETKRTRNIAFRVTEEEYAQIEKAAISSGDDPNTWCRKMALAHSTDGYALTKNEGLMYQEIALLRFLVGHGFKLAFGNDKTAMASWQKLTAQADQRSGEIVSELLSRRQPGPNS